MNNVKSASDLQRAFDVSRETMARLETYAALLDKWNPKINLVSPRSLPEKWERHFLDSAQVWRLRPEKVDRWIDLGSGGGFPGLVIAAFMADEAPEATITLVESDMRKSVFLQTVAREMGCSNVIVKRQRIETLPHEPHDVVSARALASLDKLLEFAAPISDEKTKCLFAKGAGLQDELTEAAEHWHIDFVTHASRSDASGKIVEIREFSRVSAGE